MQSKWMLRSLIAAVCVIGTTSVQATLISLDSQYALDSITLDTDTGLEWIDPWVPLLQGNSGCGYGCTGASILNAYDDIMGMIGEGGYFEGFRYATRSEVETLFYSSANFDPVTSSPGNTPTLDDKIAAGFLQSFLDSTQMWKSDATHWSAVTHGIFDDENPDDPVGGAYFFFGTWGGTLSGGGVHFYSEVYTHSNTAPYGHFLVRDSAVNVSEPSGLALLALSMMGFAGMMRSRKKSEIV